MEGEKFTAELATVVDLFGTAPGDGNELDGRRQGGAREGGRGREGAGQVSEEWLGGHPGVRLDHQGGHGVE